MRRQGAARVFRLFSVHETSLYEVSLFQNDIVPSTYQKNDLLTTRHDCCRRKGHLSLHCFFYCCIRITASVELLGKTKFVKRFIHVSPIDF